MPPELEPDPFASPEIATLAAALDTLAARYAGCAAAASEGDGRWAALTEELHFACAALRHAAPPASIDAPAAASGIAHLAVIGPTQVGKSTVVNALLGAPAAEVSPLAGFTVHPQGFWVGGEAPPGPIVDGLFSGRRRVAPGELSRAALDTFALAPAPPGSDLRIAFAGESAAQPVIVWDTPDFDSTRASAYRAGVFDTVAFADAILFVLSLEKHGDREGWQIFRTISRLSRPCLVCINKLTEPAREPVLGQVRLLLAEHGGDPAAEISTLPLAPATPAGAALPAEDRRRLAEAAAAALRAGAAQDRRPGVAALLEEGWERWWRPVRAEHAAAAAWRGLVDAALEDAVQSYRRDFLDHPQRYDSFNAVVLELLRLIELPLIGDALHRARQAITWPLRQALAYGRRWMSGSTGAARVPEEERVLRDLVDALLTRLERDAGRRTHAGAPAAGFWHTLYALLAVQRAALQEEFEHALRRHAELLREEVRRAAGDLHARLKENPVVLNSLRTALTAGDVLSVVVAVKSFGLAPSDALLIPALVAVTSTLTQGALAAYIGAVRDRLKQRQFENVRAQMDDALARPLRGLAASVSGERVIGIGESALADASAALRAWAAAVREGGARA